MVPNIANKAAAVERLAGALIAGAVVEVEAAICCRESSILVSWQTIGHPARRAGQPTGRTGREEGGP